MGVFVLIAAVICIACCIYRKKHTRTPTIRLPPPVGYTDFAHVTDTENKEDTAPYPVQSTLQQEPPPSYSAAKNYPPPDYTQQGGAYPPQQGGMYPPDPQQGGGYPLQQYPPQQQPQQGEAYPSAPPQDVDYYPPQYSYS